MRKSNFRYLDRVLVFDELEGKKTLVIGDLHIGFEESLNYSGILVGRTFLKDMKKDLKKIFDGEKEIGRKIERVVLLGDLKHNFSGNNRQEWRDIFELLKFFYDVGGEEIDLRVLRGNHDNYLKTIIGNFNKEFGKKINVKMNFRLDSVGFVHGDCVVDDIKDKGVRMIVMGHGHPAVHFREGIKVERYKCFLEGNWKGKKIVIVPSYSDYSAGVDVREESFSKLMKEWNFRLKEFDIKIFTVEENKVLDFGKIKNLVN